MQTILNTRRIFASPGEALADQAWRQARIWRLENRSAARELKRRKIAGIIDNNIVQGLTAQQWERILAKCGNACVYCGGKADLTMDHLVPLSRGGGHTASNVVPACLHCNSAKGARTPEEWLGRSVLPAV